MLSKPFISIIISYRTYKVNKILMDTYNLKRYVSSTIFIFLVSAKHCWQKKIILAPPIFNTSDIAMAAEDAHSTTADPQCRGGGKPPPTYFFKKISRLLPTINLSSLMVAAFVMLSNISKVLQLCSYRSWWRFGSNSYSGVHR